MTGLASQIEQVNKIFCEHRLAVRIKTVVLTRGLVRYHLDLGPSCSMRQIAALTDHIAQTLGLAFCRVYRFEGQVRLEMPRQSSAVHSVGPVPLLTLCRSLVSQADGQAAYPRLTAVLGIDEQEGVPLLLKLRGRQLAQVLIDGGAGCGKTSLARAIVTSLILRNSQRLLQVVAIGPGAPPFAALPHLLAPPAVDPGEIDRQLTRLLAELTVRLEEKAVAPQILVIVDDCALDDGQIGVLAALAETGAEAGIHLLVCTADPDARALAGLVEHMGVRISANGAEPGKFQITAADSVVRFMAAYIDETEFASVVQSLRSGIDVLAAPAPPPENRRRRRLFGCGSRRRNPPLAIRPES